MPEEDKVVRPDFELRRFTFWSKHSSMTTEEDLWTLRLGINQGADIIGLTQLCHGSKFVHGREAFQEAHPEYFALWDGKRATDHKNGQGAPCISSGGFFRHHLKYARTIFDHYDEPMISIDLVDGFGRGVCNCNLCEGKGTSGRGWAGLMSDYVLGYVKNLRIGTGNHDDPNIWSGDVVEFLIETQFYSYYQIAISPEGVVTDLDRAKRKNLRWDSGVQVATHKGEDYWTIEAHLPAAGGNAKNVDPLNGIAGRKPSKTYPWYINVCRQRQREEGALSAWSPPGEGGFHNVRKFGIGITQRNSSCPRIKLSAQCISLIRGPYLPLWRERIPFCPAIR